MKLYVDDDMAKASLVARMRRAGHQVVLPNDVGLSGAWDPLHLLHAVRHELVLLSKNHDDFRDLHLLVQAATGHHSGIGIVRADNDPRKDMTDNDIVRALEKLDTANVPVTNEFHILNHWR
jgi:hypothetical protein